MKSLLEVTVSDVISWGKERDIPTSDLRPQFIKLIEEVEESIIKKDQWKFEDAVGDMLVVLTNLGTRAALTFHPSDIEAQEKYAQNFLEHCLYEGWLTVLIKERESAKKLNKRWNTMYVRT